MPVQDMNGHFIDVGSEVLIPCVVTAVGGTGPVPTVTLETKYSATDGGAADSLGPIEPCQVREDI